MENGFVGIGITAVMTSYQFFLYSQGDVEGGKKATPIAVCVAVGFSLLSEVGQGMERDTIRMETKSQESPAYKAIVGALSGMAQAITPTLLTCKRLKRSWHAAMKSRRNGWQRARNTTASKARRVWMRSTR
ncbi:MAG: hypothetical protein R3E93_05820 [Thiothrix sp.]